MIKKIKRIFLFAQESIKLIKSEPNDILLGKKIRMLSERYNSGKEISADEVISDFGRGNI